MNWESISQRIQMEGLKLLICGHGRFDVKALAVVL